MQCFTKSVFGFLKLNKRKAKMYVRKIPNSSNIGIDKTSKQTLFSLETGSDKVI